MDNVLTPAGIVELSTLNANCEVARARCLKLGCKLRPHFKTHKVYEILLLQQLDLQDTVYATVSTLTEAEFIIRKNVAYKLDLLYGAMMTTPAKVARYDALVSAYSHCKMSVFVDSVAGCALLLSLSKLELINVWVLVDCGYGRAGVQTQDAEFAALLGAISASHRLHLCGFYSHAGHSYAGEQVASIARDEALITSSALDYVVDESLVATLDVSIGATPTFCIPASDDVYQRVTELHPGNYVFFDTMQESVGSCQMSDICFSVLVSITAVYTDHLLVDIGSLGLSKEKIDTDDPWGVVLGHPELKIYKTSQETSVIVARQGDLELSRYPLGSHLRLLPVHACLCATSFPSLRILGPETQLLEWEVAPHGF